MELTNVVHLGRDETYEYLEDNGGEPSFLGIFTHLLYLQSTLTCEYLEDNGDE